jgi:aromatic ring-opening dioxygenase LigB subunit
MSSKHSAIDNTVFDNTVTDNTVIDNTVIDNTVIDNNVIASAAKQSRDSVLRTCRLLRSLTFSCLSRHLYLARASLSTGFLSHLLHVHRARNDGGYQALCGA